MKTKIVVFLMTLMMSFGVAINAQDPPKSHQHAMPSMKENSSEAAKKSSEAGCPGMKSGSCCAHAETENAKMEQPKKDSKTVSVAYTCPMHPDVKSDKPGKCPKCGMDLVKKK